MFHVGDRVRCVSIDGDSETVLGFTGTVRCTDSGRIGVEWDVKFSGGHNLYHNHKENAEEGYGWWVSSDCIELIKDEGDDTPIDEDVFTKLLNVI